MATIRINAPLPLDVAGTLMRAVGTLYPGTTIGIPGPGEALVLNITDEDRGVTDQVMAEMAELKEFADAATAELELAQTDGESLKSTSGGWLAQILVPAGKAFLTSIGAEHYVEQEVIDPAGGDDTPGEMEMSMRDPDEPGVRYVFSVARSPEQTPHQLRLKAERELEELRAAVRAAHIPDEVKTAILGEGEKA